MHAASSDHVFLRSHHVDSAAHSGGTLLAHLTGTAELLTRWGAPPYVCRAGLYHSVYGTDAFTDAALPKRERDRVARQIGESSERLVFLFCTLTRDSIHANAGRSSDFFARCRNSGAMIPLSAEEVSDLFLLSTANWAEQVPRVSPELARARLWQYRAMLPHLPERPRAAVRELLGRMFDLDPQADPASLADVLSFDDASVIDKSCGALDVRYLRLVAAQLRARASADLSARLDALPDDAYLAILRSPATCARLMGPAPADPAGPLGLAAFLEGALQVEEWRAGLRARVEIDAWSADGELHLPRGTDAGPPQLLYELAHTSQDHVAGAPYLAPKIGGWVVADMHSPEVHRPLHQIVYKSLAFGPAEPWTPAERETVLDKLEQAMTGIAWVSPAAMRFLRLTLTTIMPRKQTNPHLYPSSFKGSSTAATIHRANIYNLHYPQVDAARLAQSILHETVHNHLYKRELFTPTLLDDAAGEELRVTSPWSGNTLDLYVFAHSSTVYYALHSFFSRAQSCPQLPAETSRYFRDRAVKGFASPAWQAIVDGHRDLFAPSMLRDLFAMRARVLADAATRTLRGEAVS